MASESKEAVAALETKFGEAGDAQFLMNGGFSLGTHVNIIELNGDMVDILYIYVCVYIYICGRSSGTSGNITFAYPGQTS